MIDRTALLTDLQGLMTRLEADILAYSEQRPELNAHLREEYAGAFKAKRTAEHFVDWRAAQVTQASAAWILTCVFVRFLEDNELLDEAMLAGPVGSRLQHAKERLAVYFREHPSHAEREYLLGVFEGLEALPAMGELLDHSHNPLWQMPVSADGAKRLIDFFQRIDPETGALVHDFTDPEWDTRFLGDLYQDLSESVRKRYALLQTPVFVESFILDYTLGKAKDVFPLEELRLIDPTCGSGHFLITAFERLFNEWARKEPGVNARELAVRALGAVYGVDINPYAVAIARFRLLIAAMNAAGDKKLHKAPDFHFNLAVGDSLLHGRRHEQNGGGNQATLQADDDPIGHVLDVEDKEKLTKILGQRYHVVVGNPPYITVKDKALSRAYRNKYSTCHKQYSLGVPFVERFFDLALSAEGIRVAGCVGIITANSFMKREFGKKLIEEYLSRKNLTHVIDTSGAYIPGHGTPTVILFARNSKPSEERPIRAVLGIRGEPSTPRDAARGRVWRSVVELLERPGSEDEYISVADQERALYGAHPWSIGGGGAFELKEIISAHANKTLATLRADIGFSVITGDDNSLMFAAGAKRTRGVVNERKIGYGEVVRDWSCKTDQVVVWPYDNLGNDLSASEIVTCRKLLWPHRTVLKGRKVFGVPVEQKGLRWWDLREVYQERLRIPLTIAFAFVATHNHFVLDRAGKVFNRTAPVIKLPVGSTEEAHLALLGLLNSSTACFWMKQVFQSKGNGGIGGGIGDESWEPRYEFTGTGLRSFPVPNPHEPVVLRLSLRLDHEASQLQAADPSTLLSGWDGNNSLIELLDKAADRSTLTENRMIAVQEDLDWHCYQLYGLTEDDLHYTVDVPEVRLGERAFEIALARKMAEDEVETTWFQRHGSTPITEIPGHWPADYRALVQRRLDAIESNRWIALVEQPEYKRRWNRESWAVRQQRALHQWMLDRLESLCHEPRLITCAQLADRVRHDPAFQQVAALYRDNDLYDLQALVSELVAGDEVPQVAACRYKSAAMPKFRAWQETWTLQRMEDAIDARNELDPSDPYYLTQPQAKALKAKQVGDIPLPPKYASTDFRKPTYWPLRGKLDVPKERFFSLPGCEKAGDNTLVIGWAGMNHLQRAQAIAAWYLERKEQEGWEVERLMPMLVALDELISWLKQWHNDVDPEFGERMGDYFEGFLAEELRGLELSRDDLTAWLPATATRRGRKPSKKASAGTAA